MRSFIVIAQAKTLVKKLQNFRAPVASILEKRIALVERAGILAFKRVRSLPRAELLDHLAAMGSNNIDLPFRLLLDVFERQVEDALADILESDSRAGPEVASMADKFAFWSEGGDVGKGEVDLDYMNMKMSIILNVRQQYLQRTLKMRLIDESEFEEEWNLSLQATWDLGN